LGLLLGRLLPARVLIGAGAGLGRLAARISPARRIVAANLSAMAAIGGNSAVRVSDVFAAYGRYWGELLALAARPRRTPPWTIAVEGQAHLEAAGQSRPVCLLSAHLGNWDLAALWLGQRLPGFSVVVEELRPAALFRLFSRVRESLGVTVLAADGSGRRIYRRLCRGCPVGLATDRVFGAGAASGRGRRSAPFLGGRRWFPSAGMDLARRAGAALLPVFMLRRSGGYVIKIYPPLPESGDPVAAFARVLEQEILRQPDQWCVLYPLHDVEELPTAPGDSRKEPCPREDRDGQ
jgi:KDO2-lipid IV(A) lauroyltransferase